MTKPSLLTRLVTWLHGTNWASSVGGFDPDTNRRDESERVEFVRRQEHRLVRLARLEEIMKVKTRNEDE
jgi:hypothetical protein